MNNLSCLNSTLDESNREEEFQAFKTQLNKVQDLIDEYNNKIIDKTLCLEDLDNMKKEMNYMTELELLVTAEKMKSIYVPYKVMSLKTVENSYRICNWLIEKQSSEMDNAFDINSFVNKIFEACAGRENPLDHINTLFKDVFKNTDYFNLNFLGNIKSEETDVLTQSKKEYIRKSQKRPLEEQVVPDEVENEEGNNELQMTLIRVIKCLRQAVINNKGKPIEFYKFAIDPFSLAHSVENIFHLSSLVKDRLVNIELDDETNEFTTITIGKKKEDNTENSKNTVISSLFKINYDLWKFKSEQIVAVRNACGQCCADICGFCQPVRLIALH